MYYVLCFTFYVLLLRENTKYLSFKTKQTMKSQCQFLTTSCLHSGNTYFTFLVRYRSFCRYSPFTRNIMSIRSTFFLSTICKTILNPKHQYSETFKTKKDTKRVGDVSIVLYNMEEAIPVPQHDRGNYTKQTISLRSRLTWILFATRILTSTCLLRAPPSFHSRPFSTSCFLSSSDSVSSRCSRNRRFLATEKREVVELQSSVSPTVPSDGCYNELEQWLVDQGGNCDGVTIGYNDRGVRGLIASRDASKGDVLLTVPLSVCLSTVVEGSNIGASERNTNDNDDNRDDRRKAMAPKWSATLPKKAQLAIRVLEEQLYHQNKPNDPNNPNNTWTPFLNSWPSTVPNLPENIPLHHLQRDAQCPTLLADTKLQQTWVNETYQSVLHLLPPHHPLQPILSS